MDPVYCGEEKYVTGVAPRAGAGTLAERSRSVTTAADTPVVAGKVTVTVIPLPLLLPPATEVAPV